MEDNIKIYLKKQGVLLVWTGFNWLRMGSSGGTLVYTAMNILVP
jgi:hypothetical protein